MSNSNSKKTGAEVISQLRMAAELGETVLITPKLFGVIKFRLPAGTKVEEPIPDKYGHGVPSEFKVPAASLLAALAEEELARMCLLRAVWYPTGADEAIVWWRYGISG